MTDLDGCSDKDLLHFTKPSPCVKNQVVKKTDKKMDNSNSLDILILSLPFEFTPTTHLDNIVVNLKPYQLHKGFNKIIKSEIKSIYHNKIISGEGLVKDIVDYKITDQGLINNDTGSVQVRVEVTLSITPFPQEKESFEAVVISVTHTGYYLYPSIFDVDEKIPLEIFMLKHGFILSNSSSDKNELSLGDKITVVVMNCKYSTSQYVALVKRD